jgi:hypothetical protein
LEESGDNWHCNSVNRSKRRTSENTAANRLTAREIAAGLRARLVDRAQQRNRIEGDTGTVPTLIHTPHTVVLDDELVGHHIALSQLDNQMAATPAASTGRKIGVSNNRRETTTAQLAISNSAVGKSLQSRGYQI